MDHDEALTQHAAERYLLNEMSAVERDAYEDHFFDCPHCAADVRDGARMIAAGRQIARETRNVQAMPKRGWLSWVPQAAAASIISLTVGWWGAVQTMAPRMAATAPVTQAAGVIVDREVPIESGQERGPEGAAPTEIGTNENVSLVFYVPPDAEATSYVVDVRDKAGKTVLTNDVSRKRAEEPVELALPKLPAGEYEVVIESVRKGGNRSRVTEIPIDVVEQRREEGSPTRRQP